MKRLIFAAILALIVLPLTVAAWAKPPRPPAPPAPATTKPIVRGPRFIIGVCQQPASSFKKWKTLGVNTVQGVPLGADPIAWRDEAQRVGMWEIRAPIGLAADDVKDQNLIAWEHNDEPDKNNIPVALLAVDRERGKATGMPWFLNVSGGMLTGYETTHPTDDVYKQFFAQADWVGTDIYPVSGWNNNIPSESPGEATDRALKLSGNKPCLQYVEFGYQGAPWLANPWLAPTPAEFKLQVRQAVVRGCRGIIIFPLQPFSGFSWDTSTPEMKLALQDFADTVNGNPAAGLNK